MAQLLAYRIIKGKLAFEAVPEALKESVAELLLRNGYKEHSDD
jgi:hypothetical protein